MNKNIISQKIKRPDYTYDSLYNKTPDELIKIKIELQKKLYIINKDKQILINNILFLQNRIKTESNDKL